ncbi:hypothetical protein CH063_00106 [Colletotrichum higginsianum]|uniref:Uncharacterized protein n=1 Tax=Colletotrichum higginsianum (strain IMI 349063) TaxID=759273 RepID=H1UW35_COLHI|nr:hypothetical protein CH63R_14495 [Colletotrichum higginsianum IMI 349063]OBR02194.1 hypothetical protein CH63R_14495 [Colletotrichum higginsianum IMI 349063]CCF32186.1 hypothetical protein CH063_00106 [Colletotrichum higginsianum]
MEKLRDSISNLIAAAKPMEIRPRLIRDFLQESESFNQVIQDPTLYQITSEREWAACIALFDGLASRLTNQSTPYPQQFREWDLAQYKWLDIGYCTRLLYELTLSLHVTAQEKLQPVPTITQQHLLKFRGKILTHVADDLLYLQHQIRHLSSLSAPTLVAEDAKTDTSDENLGQLTHCIFDAGLHPTSSNPEVRELRKDFLSKVAPPRSAE